MGFNHRPNLTKRQRDYSKLIHVSAYSLQSLVDEVIDLGNVENRVEGNRSAPGQNPAPATKTPRVLRQQGSR
jgi:hypothetical protein